MQIAREAATITCPDDSTCSKIRTSSMQPIRRGSNTFLLRHRSRELSAGYPQSDSQEKFKSIAISTADVSAGELSFNSVLAMTAGEEAVVLRSLRVFRTFIRNHEVVFSLHWRQGGYDSHEQKEQRNLVFLAQIHKALIAQQDRAQVS